MQSAELLHDACKDKSCCPDNFEKTFANTFHSAHIHLHTNANNIESKIASLILERLKSGQNKQELFSFMYNALNWSDYYYHCCHCVDRIKL